MGPLILDGGKAMWSYLCALQAMNPCNYVPAEEVEEALPYHLNPEKELIAKEIALGKGLSEEAKFVVRLVLESPQEMGLVTKKAITEHLRSLGWPYKKIWLTFNEIREWLKEV